MCSSSSWIWLTKMLLPAIRTPITDSSVSQPEWYAHRRRSEQARQARERQLAEQCELTSPSWGRLPYRREAPLGREECAQGRREWREPLLDAAASGDASRRRVCDSRVLV